MIHWEVRCKGCGRKLDEAPDLTGDRRQPCPACGSLGRERTVLMIPGEPGAAKGSPEAAWLDLGSALTRAASALDQLLADQLTYQERESSTKARAEVQKALDEYRAANKKMREESGPDLTW